MCFKYWYVCLRKSIYICEREWRLGSVGVVFNGIYFLRRCNWDKAASCSHLLQHSSLRWDCQGQRWEDADTSGNLEIISSMDKIFWFAKFFSSSWSGWWAARWVSSPASRCSAPSRFSTLDSSSSRDLELRKEPEKCQTKTIWAKRYNLLWFLNGICVDFNQWM